jgi:hypothetical protein
MPADYFIPANYHLLVQLPPRCGSATDRADDQGSIAISGKPKLAGLSSITPLFCVTGSPTIAITNGFTLSRAMRLTQQANFRQNRRLPKPRLLAGKPEEKW